MLEKIQVKTNLMKNEHAKIEGKLDIRCCGVQSANTDSAGRERRRLQRQTGGSEYQEQRLERILVFGPEAADEMVNLSEGGETAA